MATGLPILATSAGLIPQAVADGVEALLVPQRDAAALALAVERLMADTALLTRPGAKAARRFREQFDVRVTERAFHERVLGLVGAATT